MMKTAVKQCGAFRDMAFALKRSAVLCVFVSQLAACQCIPASLTDADTSNIDNMLILMDQRLALAPKVAQAKWNSGAPIDDKDREAQILAKVRQQSEILGIDPQWAVSFFQGQMNANKLYQQQLHEQWRREALPPFAKVPDLTRDVRPVLDGLQAKLLFALRDISVISFNSNVKSYLMGRAKQLMRKDFKGDVRSAAVLSLLERKDVSP